MSGRAGLELTLRQLRAWGNRGRSWRSEQLIGGSRCKLERLRSTGPPRGCEGSASYVPARLRRPYHINRGLVAEEQPFDVGSSGRHAIVAILRLPRFNSSRSVSIAGWRGAAVAVAGRCRPQISWWRWWARLRCARPIAPPTGKPHRMRPSVWSQRVCLMASLLEGRFHLVNECARTARR